MPPMWNQYGKIWKKSIEGKIVMRRAAISSILIFILYFSIIISSGNYLFKVFSVDTNPTDACDSCEENFQKDLNASKIEGELSNIKDSISKKGAKWKADLTKVSQLTFEERKKLCGTKIQKVHKDVEILSTPLDEIPFGTYDWRNVNGTNWMTPVRHQGSCGSCWAFGTLGSMEAVINIEYNDPSIDMDLSEQTLVSCSGAGSCSGGSPYSAYNYIRETGIPDEVCFPYVASNVPCERCSDWEDRAWFITSWTMIANDTNSIKWALQNYGPLGAAMYAPDDFLFYSSGIYESVWSSQEWVQEFSAQANHWVTVVGYDDSQEYWIIKNSWGTYWGDEGYAKIAYGVLEPYNCFYAIIGVQGTVQEVEGYVSDAESDIVNAAKDEVTFIYPDYIGTKPGGVKPAALSDWTAAGYVIGMCSNIQIEATDTNSEIINSSNGSPIAINKTVVLFGGPCVNAPVNYYERERISPLYFRGIDGAFYWYKADGTQLVETGLTPAQVEAGQDMFVIESFVDDLDNNVYIVYGYGWKGTFAGGKFFKFVIYPDIESYINSYYVFKWVDSNGDGFVDLSEIITIPVSQG
jgi:C1A family cysteine protease